MTKEFEDRYWKQTLDPTAIIINGNCFHVGNENTKGFRGFSGAKFKIQITETSIAYDKGEVIITTNLWHQGKVPERFNVKDNAVLIKEDGFTTLCLE